MSESSRLRATGGREGKHKLAALRRLGRMGLAPLKAFAGGASAEPGASWMRSRMGRIPTLIRTAILAGTAGLVALILFPGMRLAPATHPVGEIATEDIRAAHTFEVADQAATLKKKEEAAAAVLPVYDFDEGWTSETEDRIRDAFAVIRTLSHPKEAEAPVDILDRAGQGAPAQSSRAPLVLAPNAKQEFERTLGSTVFAGGFEALIAGRFDKPIEDAIIELVGKLGDETIVADSRALRWGKDKGIVVRGLPSRREEARDPAKVLKLREAEDLVVERSRDVLSEFVPALRTPLTKIAAGLLAPNLTFNKAETDERRAAAAAAVDPVYFRVQKGEMIIREGDPFLPSHLVKLEAIRSEAGRAGRGLMTVGLAGMTILFLALGLAFATGNLKGVDPTGKDILFLASLLVGEVALIKLSAFLSSSVRNSFPLVPLSAYAYGIPFALGPMLVRLVLNAETAFVFAAAVMALAGIAMDNSFFLLLYSFIGSLVGIHGVARCDRRMTIAKAGLGVGGMNFLLVGCFALLKGGAWSQAAFRDLSFELLGGCLGGLAVAILVAGLTPIVEGLFGYTTDSRLLELANLDHPLLKELTLKAPGTYHHSVVIGSMVETAAKSIGANALLARVAAYYHDIGKLAKPHYFSENQESGENPHDRLSPAMSTLILLNHVKEGVDLARRHRLGERVAGMIQQSHGTALIDYFYDKAKNLAPSDQPPDGTYFRYPGPKPQTREAGLLMLADAVEAASRTLTDWTPARAQGLVQKIVNRKFSDGQLDECEMTLKDLDAIAKSFTKSLAAVYRRRIDYPEPAYKLDTGKRRGPEGSAAREPGKGRDRTGKGGKSGPEGLRRLGMS